jgi:1,4-alpha-glucan branching enzyme
MKKLIALYCLTIVMNANGQLLKTEPNFILESSNNVVVTADASKGNKGLLNYTGDVYVHIGVITNLSANSSAWKYVPSYSIWSGTDARIKCTSIGNNKWTYTIPGTIRSFFGLTDATEKIIKLAILFRNAAGTKLTNEDGSDMFLTVVDNQFQVKIDTPAVQPLYLPQFESIKKVIGDTVFVNVKSTANAKLSIYYNDTLINSIANSSSLSAYKVINKIGTQKILVSGDNGSSLSKDSLNFLVAGAIAVNDLPAGVSEGINYHLGDTSVTLVLYAPKKSSVSVIGDFNNWTAGLSDVMNRTKDSTYFWIKINGLTPGQEYAYQYVIDDNLKVADYTTEKILDPNNDAAISAATYPNLKAYPTGKTTGIVSILQTAKPTYQWKDAGFVRPNKKNLIIYELLIRDFVQKQNFQTLKDSLDYFKKLGINAIEIMPFSEFEGNDSWGYNSSFYFAPDKFYGTEQAIKEFIDAAHAKGIAVIMDMVLNHVFNASPLAQMYWDSKANAPSATNPWLNTVAKHPYNVGNDFNHESTATKQLVTNVVKHWLTKYHIDGFRWDMSKGFTQKNTLNDVAAWGAYDATRIAIWKNIYDTMQKASVNSYCILEHFADNSEEKVLADYGMLLWGNANYNFNQATMGYTSDASFDYAFANGRGWSQQNLVTYMESHDEERLMYKNINYGNTAGAYSTRDINTGLKRNEMAAAFWALTPGPKSMWQFGELGYDYSINTCSDLSINNNCRLSTKPLKWDYLANANRKGLYNAYAQFLKLRNNPSYTNDFISNKYTVNSTGVIKSMQLNGDSIKLVVLGNFDVNTATANIAFPADGYWYSLTTNKYQLVSGGSASMTLQPGEYYVFANKNISSAVITDVLNIGMPELKMAVSFNPNPMTSSSMVRYQLPESGQLSIHAFNMNGSDCGTLFSGYKFKGDQQFIINKNASMQMPGIYFISFTLNQKQKINKLLITN